MVRKRPLTPEEKLLWKEVTKSVKRLNNSTSQEPLPNPPLQAGEGIIQSPLSTLVGRAREGVLKQGSYAGIDRNTAEKFRKGETIIDARLDLHGMTAEKAHKALISFINKQVKLENRRLLVITGKGSGILRSSLPDWLAAPSINGFILAFDTAQAKHGGTGAYYILLKRKRTKQ